MRREFEMTEAQLDRLLAACAPTPVMAVGDPAGGPPIPMFKTPQENANDAWAQLGRELGFDWTTASPVTGKSARFFIAEALP